MDARDRPFATIALRLQLLSREQIHACVAHSARHSGQRMGEAAVALGYMSSDEVSLVRMQEARMPKPAGVEEVAGGQAGRRDPRQVSAAPQRQSQPQPQAQSQPQPQPQPLRAAASPRPAERKRAPAHEWQAVDESQDAIVVPQARPSPAPARQSAPPARTAAYATGSSRDDPTEPIAHMHAIAMASAHATSIAGTMPPPEASPSSFPLANDEEEEEVSEINIAPRSSRPAGGTQQPGKRVVTISSGSPAAAPQPAADFRAVSAPFGHTAQGMPAPTTPQHPTIPTPLPPKAATIRPNTEALIGSRYLDKALGLAARQGASDLHVHSGSPLLARIDGQLRPLSGSGILQAEAADTVIADITNDEQWAILSKKGEVDFAYQLPGVGRFRVNVFRQQRGLDAVFRLVPERPRSLEELGLPQKLARLVDYRTGLVLCTGPAGCGKSSTLAALLATLVSDRAEHVLTIEDPVEFVIPPGQAMVNQRQVGDHTSSFARALRAALREDPDVIAITDLRDRDTMSLAISAAETGHLVLGSLHTGSAAQTILRIVGSFAPGEREQVRVMLAESLRAIISQRLLPRADGKGRVPAFELMMVNTAVSSLIREDKTFQLPSVMQTGKAAGMITLDDSIHELLQQRLITVETARKFSVRKDRF
jgi:twitching motility protein PilT